MKKYSDSEIKKRAQIFVQADKHQDPRAFMLLMQMVLVTGTNPDAIRRKIYAIASF